jgi:hypothetical protein
MKVEKSYNVDMSENERKRIIAFSLAVANGLHEGDFIDYIKSMLNDAFELGMLEAEKK